MVRKNEWNGWAVFTCTRQVAEAIVADQQQGRDRYRQALRDQGVAEDDLDRQVNQSLAILAFDGDTIVADQRAVNDDPEAIEYIDPDPEGRYVVMGRNWCWLPVEPADCDRIVGDLPAPGEQQQFIELTHTPAMRVPHDRLRLRVLRHWPTGDGLAFTGVLTLNSNPVAAIGDDGDGARFGTPDWAPGWPGMAEYLAGCRYQGAPVTPGRLLDALADEYHLSAAVAQADADGVALVRLVDDAGYTRTLRRVVPPPRGWHGLRDLGRILTREWAPSSPAGRWQIWGGTGWVHLASVGDNIRGGVSGGEDADTGEGRH